MMSNVNVTDVTPMSRYSTGRLTESDEARIWQDNKSSALCTIGRENSSRCRGRPLNQRRDG